MEWKYRDKIDGLGRTWLVYVDGSGFGSTMMNNEERMIDGLAYALSKSSLFLEFLFSLRAKIFFLFLLMRRYLR